MFFAARQWDADLRMGKKHLKFKKIRIKKHRLEKVFFKERKMTVKGKSAGNSARFDLVFAGFLTAFGPFATDVKLPATATCCNDGAPAEPAFAAAGEAVDE